MASERESFDLSGPLRLTSVNWYNPDHRRSVAACLVQAVYILERDRHEKRRGDQILAPPWWKFFHFQLHCQLVDDADQSIFGAIFEFTPLTSISDHPVIECPRYVIAFRGTITKGDAFTRDLELDVRFIRNELHRTSRVEIATQAVRNVVATFGSSSVWLAGHSLGSAVAMHTGKNMAKTGVFLEAFLFNPPFVSAPIENIKDQNVRHGVRIASSFLTAGFAVAMKNRQQKNNGSVDTFAALSRWLPTLFVNPCDHICSEYIGYFEHRKRMEDIGAGVVERLATQHSIGGLVMNAMGKESEEPLHLIPSANLVVNLTQSRDFRDAHGIHQWWRPRLLLQSNTYQFS